MATACSAIAKSGSRCRFPALPGSAFCLAHDPAAADRRREAARKGGKARANAERARKQIPPAMSAEALAGWLSLLFTQVLTGRVEPKIGTACAAIARTLLEAHVAAAQPSIAELEEHVAMLRALIERQGHAA